MTPSDVGLPSDSFERIVQTVPRLSSQTLYVRWESYEVILSKTNPQFGWRNIGTATTVQYLRFKTASGIIPERHDGIKGAQWFWIPLVFLGLINVAFWQLYQAVAIRMDLEQIVRVVEILCCFILSWINRNIFNIAETLLSLKCYGSSHYSTKE